MYFAHIQDLSGSFDSEGKLESRRGSKWMNSTRTRAIDMGIALVKRYEDRWIFPTLNVATKQIDIP
jgi:hypothetical protein